MCFRLGYEFKNKKLLEEALIHSSFKIQPLLNNERMEFFGDRILGFIIAEYLFQFNSSWKEGILAIKYNSLVCRETCAEIADSIDLGSALIMGKSESRHGGRGKRAILADAIEALISAVYLDSNLHTVREIVRRLWSSRLTDINELHLDSKTALQHWVQARGMELPSYTDLKRSGPDHSPVFSVEVKLQNGLTAIGEDKSKRAAQQVAAEGVLKKINDLG